MKPFSFIKETLTDALHLALLACGIKPADEVITTPFTFIATAEAITQCGAIPAFVDMDPKTYNIDPQKLQQLLKRKISHQSPVTNHQSPITNGAGFVGSSLSRN